MQKDNLFNIRHKWLELITITEERVKLRHKELIRNWKTRIFLLGLDCLTFTQRMRERAKGVEDRVSRQWLGMLMRGQVNPTNRSVMTVEKHLHDLEAMQDRNESN